MKQVRFEESEVPYQTLARFGLTQEKIEDLPMWALEDIGQGRRSPLLPIQVNNDEGETLKSRTRFALVRMEDGKVDVVFYPQLEKSPLEAFTQEQQEDLLAGKAILADVKDADGRSSKAFVQIDTETNQVMSVPTPVIGRNLEVLKDELKLSSAELTVMQKLRVAMVISGRFDAISLASGYSSRMSSLMSRPFSTSMALPPTLFVMFINCNSGSG